MKQQDKRIRDARLQVICAGFAGHEHEVALQQSCSMWGAWLQAPALELQALLLETARTVGMIMCTRTTHRAAVQFCA